eukprot:570450-Pleurochrysis_carterae.AAC.6
MKPVCDRLKEPSSIASTRVTPALHDWPGARMTFHSVSVNLQNEYQNYHGCDTNCKNNTNCMQQSDTPPSMVADSI